jgi:hypothetical protein
MVPLLGLIAWSFISSETQGIYVGYVSHTLVAPYAKEHS